MKKQLFVVLIENSHSGGCDILGGVFDNKKDMDEFIEKNDLKNQGFCVEKVKLNKWNYQLIK